MRFSLNTFKCGISKDNNRIHNSFTKVPLYTSDEMVLMVNEYAQVEDDKTATKIAPTTPNSGKKQGGGRARLI